MEVIWIKTDTVPSLLQVLRSIENYLGNQKNLTSIFSGTPYYYDLLVKKVLRRTFQKCLLYFKVHS